MFLLGIVLAPSQLVLVCSTTKVPKDFSHVAVVLVVNNPVQRDEHTKRAIHKCNAHACACISHTHTLNAHMIYTCMYVWIVYSPCLLDVIDLIGCTHTHTYVLICTQMHACTHMHCGHIKVLLNPNFKFTIQTSMHSSQWPTSSWFVQSPNPNQQHQPPYL